MTRAGRDDDGAEELLRQLGQRVRDRRQELRMTRRKLAWLSGLSQRFLAEIEAGTGNVSISRLRDLAGALELPVAALLAEPGTDGIAPRIEGLLAGRTARERERILAHVVQLAGQRRPSSVALLGVRGAGKSTVGPRIADRLALPFVELDEHIEAQAGLDLAEIFALHGEPWYRRLEARCLARLLEPDRGPSGEGPLPTLAVVALPGGIVFNEDADRLVREHCVRVWLKARPEDLMARLIAQGDRRPMANRVDADAELTALLEAREARYREAEIVVDTTGRSPAEVADEVVGALEESGFVFR